MQSCFLLLQIVYRDACSGADCLAAKGAKYARIIKTTEDRQEDGSVRNMSKVFNIFATHMQAWYSPADKADRCSPHSTHTKNKEVQLRPLNLVLQGETSTAAAGLRRPAENRSD